MPHGSNDGSAFFREVRENDKVLFNSRSLPLTVQDVGNKDDGSRYINVIGPRGGGPYHIIEQYGQRGTPKHYNDTTGERVSDLRIEERYHQDDDSPAGPRMSREEFENVLRDARANAQQALAGYDYPDLRSAVEDIASQAVEGLDEAKQRAIPTFVASDAEDPAAALADAVEQDMVPQSAFDGEPTITTTEDYEDLVDAGATKVRTFRGDDPSGELSEQAAGVAATIVASLEPADHAQVVHFGPTHEGPPSLEPHDLEDHAATVLAHSVYAEVRDREDESVRSKAAATVMEADEYLREMFGSTGLLDSGVSWHEFKADLGTSAEEIHAEVKDRLPTLSDSLGPHTLVDELNNLYHREVVTAWNNWRMVDPGIVTDAKRRQMAWKNERTGEVVAIIGETRDAMNRELAAAVDKWTVWRKKPVRVMTDGGTVVPPQAQRMEQIHAAQAAKPEPVHSTDNLVEAHEFAEEYITEGEQAHFEVIEDSDGAVIRDDVDYEEVGKRLFRDSGYSIGPLDIPVPTEHAREQAKAAAREGASLAGSGVRATGRAVGRGVGAAGRFAWENWKDGITKAVQHIMLVTAVAGINYLGKARTSVVADEDRVGVNVAAKHAPDDDELDTESEGFFDLTVSRQKLGDKLGIGRRVTYALGLIDDDPDTLYQQVENLAIDSGVLLGAPGRMSDAERGPLGEIRNADVSSPSRRSRSKKQQGRLDADQREIEETWALVEQSQTTEDVDDPDFDSGGETVGGSSGEQGQVRTEGAETVDEMLDLYRASEEDPDDEDDYEARMAEHPDGTPMTADEAKANRLPHKGDEEVQEVLEEQRQEWLSDDVQEGLALLEGDSRESYMDIHEDEPGMDDDYEQEADRGMELAKISGDWDEDLETEVGVEERDDFFDFGDDPLVDYDLSEYDDYSDTDDPYESRDEDVL